MARRDLRRLLLELSRSTSPFEQVPDGDEAPRADARRPDSPATAPA